MDENPQLQLAYDYVQSTGEHVFLTGKAGTGKTTFLRSLHDRCSKRLIVVAPTGVAAINAGGVTIHSFFQMPFGPLVPETGPGLTSQDNRLARRFNKTKINIIKSLDLLVIDEISMVRADLLDGIDTVLRRYRDRTRPFGGVQLLMIGDLQQLAPVIKNEDWAILRQYYTTGFFFGSLALQQTNFVTIELKHIYRQRDERFIALLNKVRTNQLDAQASAELNQRFREHYTPPENDGTITLTTHNAQAQRLNDAKLDALPTKARIFEAQIHDDFPEYLYPTEAALKLKVGTQVMFVKNDSRPEKRYFNGKIGTLTAFEADSIVVHCPDESDPLLVTPETWQNTKYTLDDKTKEIQEEVAGEFIQMPLKPAWAITIHKSQGLTFDKAVIDAQAAFAHGQVYVALSRCRSLEGLVLSTPIRSQGLPTDANVVSFTDDRAKCPPGPEQLAQAQHVYQQSLVLELFDFGLFHRSLARILNRVKEQASALPQNPVDVFMDLGREMREQISSVAEKFHAQIKVMSANPSIAIETNEGLQDRIHKGCQYFLDKMNTLLIPPLESISIETDNQTARKSVGEALDQLLQQAQHKKACLTACASGFSVTAYLKARAEAAIVTQGPRKHQPSQDTQPLAQQAHPKLYRQLKTWRSQKAKAEGVPPNTLITLKTLNNIANDLPLSLLQLKQVRGVGKKTLAHIGKELVVLVTTYHPPQEGEIVELPPQKQSSGDTKQISLTLFNAGKSIPEIAQERELAQNTIESHLAHFVRHGDLPLQKLIPLDKAQPALAYLEQAQLQALSPAKEKFGEQYTYGELRIMLNHLIYTGAIKG